MDTTDPQLPVLGETTWSPTTLHLGGRRALVAEQISVEDEIEGRKWQSHLTLIDLGTPRDVSSLDLVIPGFSTSTNTFFKLDVSGAAADAPTVALHLHLIDTTIDNPRRASLLVLLDVEGDELLERGRLNLSDAFSDEELSMRPLSTSLRPLSVHAIDDLLISRLESVVRVHRWPELELVGELDLPNLEP